MQQVLTFITLFCIAIATHASTQRYTLESPDKSIRVSVEHAKSGGITYQIHKNDTPVIAPSPLGFMFKTQAPLSTFNVIGVETKHVDTTWNTIWGQRKQIRDYHNELLVKLHSKHDSRALNLRFRAFNDGVGFRYEHPQIPQLSSLIISDELTEFRFPEDHDTWWVEANYDSYEKLYQNTPLNQTKHVNTPITLVTKTGLHISLHEAALTDFASMTLIRNANNTLKAELVPWKDGSKVRTSGQFISPWRTIQISESAAELVQSTMILNLNEPNQISDTQWIEPMKFMGIWWSIHIGVHTWTTGPRHGANTENAIQYIDFAHQNNIGGVLFEGWNKGWEQWGKRDAYVIPADDFDLEKVAAYARKKGVRIVGHNETGGNVEAYEKHVEEIFSIYSSLGINTVKTGYVAEQGLSNGEHHQGQWGVNHYRRIVKLAAKYKIMINAHEPIKATGIRRTYPNMMTREGARGGEWNAWSDGNPPEHTLILPFTRLLGGPMDYTVGILDIDYSRFAGKRYDWQGNPQTAPYRVHTTLARQLANAVILYSPLQMTADLLENYQDNPAFEFLKNLTVDYDTSTVPHAKIGEYISVVRRAGDEWFIGSATNKDKRQLTLALDFLPKGKQYNATIYRDADDAHWQTNPEAYVIDKRSVSHSTQLTMTLAPGGGTAIRIYPKK